MAAPRIPSATYRLQFNRNFRFADARALVPYLHELGITDLYASPIFKARPDSAHGYDVTDPTRLNPELGTEEEFEALVRELQTHGLGLLLDIVPNHMAATVDNPWWADVLENGQSSRYASYFDIDWSAHPQERIVLPVLHAPLEDVLENRELTLGLDDFGFFVRYHDTRFPLDPTSYAVILSHRPGLSEPLTHVVASLEHLPTRTVTGKRKARERRQAAERVKRDLWRVHRTRPEVQRYVDESISVFNGRDPGPLDQLLGQQAYELAFWRTGRERLNYRRFFDISDLVGVLVDDPAVFEATHELVVRLVGEGKVTGLRVDHIDGLRNPLGYLRRLQEAVPQDGSQFYVLVEKILLGDEAVPEDWPAFGTTGYEYANLVNGLFVDPQGLRALHTTYSRFTGSPAGYADVAYEQKKKVMKELFPGELRDLALRLCDLVRQERPDEPTLNQALVEVCACLPVYRTYTRNFEVAARDRAHIEAALEEADRRNPAFSRRSFDFVRRVLLLDLPPSLPPQDRQRWLEFVMRWQQFTGPVTAKGLEDTALYNYHRLVSLNEVGGDPGGAHVSHAVERFHRHNAETLGRWPHTLNATSTHDTKRSEDVRARINVLSEIAAAWARRLNRWSRLNRGKKSILSGRSVPDPNEEMLLYQTLIGAWPLDAREVPKFGQRLKAFAIKAAREAKVNTSWLDPDEPYEGALASFVETILDDSAPNRFLDDFFRFEESIAYYGVLNSLAQTLLKIASPGVPDFFQGTELWDFSLVDPDNRRPVDFTKRSQMIPELKSLPACDTAGLARGLMTRWRDGRIKMCVIARALGFRKAHAALFQSGDYVPLQASGTRAEHVVAFARRHQDEWALVAAPRLVQTLCGPGRPPLGRRAWKNTLLLLPPGAPERWLDGLTGGTLSARPPPEGMALELAKVFRHLPVALLSGVSR